jgi:poly(A) polymerase
VGGIVRDLLLGRDLGAATSTSPPTPAPTRQGAGVRLGRRRVDAGRALRHHRPAKKGDRTFEITTHRAEAYAPDSRKPDVQFADEVEADLSRRDFTVNAMALALPDRGARAVDPFGGAADLAARRAAHAAVARGVFTDDPLRMLRAARFIAGYGLEPDPSWWRRSRRCATGWRSCRPSASATSSTS